MSTKKRIPVIVLVCALLPIVGLFQNCSEAETALMVSGASEKPISTPIDPENLTTPTSESFETMNVTVSVEKASPEPLDLVIFLDESSSIAPNIEAVVRGLESLLNKMAYFNLRILVYGLGPYRIDPNTMQKAPWVYRSAIKGDERQSVETFSLKEPLFKVDFDPNDPRENSKNTTSLLQSMRAYFNNLKLLAPDDDTNPSFLCHALHYLEQSARNNNRKAALLFITDEEDLQYNCYKERENIFTEVDAFEVFFSSKWIDFRYRKRVEGEAYRTVDDRMDYNWGAQFPIEKDKDLCTQKDFIELKKRLVGSKKISSSDVENPEVLNPSDCRYRFAIGTVTTASSGSDPIYKACSGTLTVSGEMERQFNTKDPLLYALYGRYGWSVDAEASAGKSYCRKGGWQMTQKFKQFSVDQRTNFLRTSDTPFTQLRKLVAELGADRFFFTAITILKPEEILNSDQEIPKNLLGIGDSIALAGHWSSVSIGAIDYSNALGPIREFGARRLGTSIDLGDIVGSTEPFEIERVSVTYADSSVALIDKSAFTFDGTRVRFNSQQYLLDVVSIEFSIARRRL